MISLINNNNNNNNNNKIPKIRLLELIASKSMYVKDTMLAQTMKKEDYAQVKVYTKYCA